jgi:hypothetical protein
MKTIVRFLSTVIFFSICIVGILTVAGVVTPDVFGATFMFAAPAGGILEGATPTTATATAKSSDLLLNKISQSITKMKPASTPLDTLLRTVVKNVPAKSWRYDYYAVDMRGVEDTLHHAFDTSASGTYEGSGVHTLTVSNIHIWSKDDNGMLIGVLGSDGKDIVFNVISKNAANSTISVLPLNGSGVGTNELPDMDPAQKIVRMGNSKSELDAQTDPYSIFPDKAWNYNQIHMAQVEESVYLEMHEKEVAYGMADFKYASLYDMRRGCEFDTLFGVRKQYTDPDDQEEKYSSGGITRYITQTLSYVAGVTAQATWKAYWNNWTKTIFTDNSGSDTRYFFVGKDLLEAMANIDSFQKQIDAKSVEVVHGINFSKIETPFGILLIKLHNLFAPAGWAAKGLVLDLPNLEKFTFKPMATEKLDLRSAGIKNANAFKIDEAFGVALRYPQTHAIIDCVAASV